MRLKSLMPSSLILLFVIGCASTCKTCPQTTQKKHDQEAQLEYPNTRTVDQVDAYHGVEVADPYRWLEDLDSSETAQWVEAQNEVTFGYLEQIPQRSQIESRLTDLWNYERFGVPFKEGGRYFYSKNDGLQNQSVFYTMNALDDTPRELLNPNTWSEDGTVALSGMAVSEDGQYLAYGYSSGGSDWQEWKIRNIETGEDLDDQLQWIKFSGASWTHDNKGFFYSRYDEPEGENKLKAVNYYQKLYYHTVGQPQSEDVLVYERPDEKEWGFGSTVTEDGKYLVISVWRGTERKNLVFYKDLSQGLDAPVVEMINEFEAQYGFVGNEGPIFWFQTDQDAPRNRVIAIDIRNPEQYNWKEVIPQSKDTLEGVSLVGNRFIATYMHDANNRVQAFSLDGEAIGEVALPGIGSVGGFGGERDDNETFYAFTSFTWPTTVYRYDVSTGKSELFRKADVDFDPSGYETKQVFYQSKDGTSIPMFITHRKGIKLDGSNPTLLYGYGGFNVSLTPYFSVSNLVWMEMGGVYAMPNLRGGGEYGKEWHEAGMKLNKQNVFDDFIAAAEWLIDHKYTSPDKLAIFGGSNGGLLVGACMVQRPDLFAAALPAVGVLDMLRFPEFTIGWAWTSDYGSPENPEEFQALYAYSPYHNLRRNTQYPATLITTADHDDRVFPGHSFKFAAALQEAHTGNNPVLIRIETRAGHGAGKPTSKRIEETADRMAFLVKTLNMNPKIKN